MVFLKSAKNEEIEKGQPDQVQREPETRTQTPAAPKPKEVAPDGNKPQRTQTRSQGEEQLLKALNAPLLNWI